MILTALCGLASADNAPGWLITLSPARAFVGDPINATIRGPLTDNGEHLKVQLLDPNGTVVESGYPTLQNSTARFSYVLRLTATPGNYSIRVYINTTTLVATLTFEVIFDDVNFLAKQQAITDQRLQDLQKQSILWRQKQQETQRQVDGFWWLPILAFLVLIFILFSGFFAIAPTFAMLVALKYPMDTNLTLQSRFIRWFVAPSGAADLRTYDFTRRFQRNPLETDGIVRAFYRQLGQPEPTIPRVSKWGDEHYLHPMTVEHKPMKPLKVVKRAGVVLQRATPRIVADNPNLSPLRREMKSLEDSIEYLQKKYGEEGHQALGPLITEQKKRLADLKAKDRVAVKADPTPPSSTPKPEAPKKPES